MFLTYEEYKEYGGGLDETAFKIYGYEAEKKVDAETHGRFKTATEKEPVKRCIVRLADIMEKADVVKNKITSWNNEGVSKSIKEVSFDDYNTKITNIIRDYLANVVDETGTPLLYLGVGV